MRPARRARPREKGERAGAWGRGGGRSSASGGPSRSLTPAVATLARGCFLHPGIFWSLHPGSSKVPGPKTGSKCDGTFRSQPPPGPLRPVEPVRPPSLPSLLRRRPASAAGPPGSAGGCERGLGDAEAAVPARSGRGLPLGGPGRWRRPLGLPRRGTCSRRGTAATRQGRKMAAASEELNGAGTPGGGVGWPGAAGRIEPGDGTENRGSLTLFCLFVAMGYLGVRSRWFGEEGSRPHPPDFSLFFFSFLTLFVSSMSLPDPLGSLRLTASRPRPRGSACWPSLSLIKGGGVGRATGAHAVPPAGHRKTPRRIDMANSCQVPGKQACPFSFSFFNALGPLTWTWNISSGTRSERVQPSPRRRRQRVRAPLGAAEGYCSARVCFYSKHAGWRHREGGQSMNRESGLSCLFPDCIWGFTNIQPRWFS